MSIQDNLKRVTDRINEAKVVANREQEEITLVTVSKTISTKLISEAITAGAADLGENRIQELVLKQQELPEFKNWHLIGQIQKNKVKYIKGVKLIHSLNSISLASELNKQGLKTNTVYDVLIELNLSNEQTKTGLRPEGFEELLNGIADYRNINVLGMMTMAPYGTDDDTSRPYFATLKKIFEDLKSKKIFSMEYLSMGMSNDYYGAILEGANILRIGSAIFQDL